MSAVSERADAIEITIDAIRTVLAGDVSQRNLNQGLVALMELAGRPEFFSSDAFPTPDGEAKERTFRLHEDPDGRFALYAISSLPGAEYRPHDHGGT